MRSSVILTFLFILFTSFSNICAKKNKKLVTHFVKRSESPIFGKASKYYCILIESKESEDYDDYFDEFEKAAKNFEEKVKFVFINADIEENWEVIEYLGIIAEEVPMVMFINLDKGLTKYKATFKEITKGNIISFTKDCLDGNAPSFQKSEEVPKDWDSQPVKQLVGLNFEEAVFGSKKTSFVFFYAPWCQACKSTMPEIEKLGKLYAKNKNIMIAKMDSTINEVPKMPVFDVPTIALFVNGNRKPIFHTDDDRTVTSFSKFITTNMKKAKEGAQDEEKPIAEEKTKEREAKKEEKTKTGTKKAATEKIKKGEERKSKSKSKEKKDEL